MTRALELAAGVGFRSRPNPRVGALLVRDGELLGEGSTQAYGADHAEADLLRRLGDPALARGATLYVTLEPCGDFPGKNTPSCLQALLPLGLKRVVIATPDPHSGTAGASAEALRGAGVEVALGCCAEAARRLNGPFFKAQVRRARGLPPLPYVSAKWAMSLDGKIACHTGHSQWISGPDSRRAVHVLRGEVDAVVVGIGTALADDPRLNRRDVPGGDPLPVVLDREGRLPLDSELVRGATERGLLVVVGPQAEPARASALERAGAEVLRAPDEDTLAALLTHLGNRGADHVLIEGGGGLLASAFAGDHVDRALVFLAPRILGGLGAPGPVGGLGVEEVSQGRAPLSLEARPSGADLLVEAHFRLYP